MSKNNPVLMVLVSTLLLSWLMIITACGDEAVPAAVSTLPPQPSAPPTATIIPTTPTPQPTATLAARTTNEWASVKSGGTEVKTEPKNDAPIVEKLGGFTIVALQRKLIDESWLERVGGGWLPRRDVIIYANEYEARRSAPQVTQPPTPIPTYNSSPIAVPTPAFSVNAGIIGVAQLTQTAVVASTALAKLPAKAPGSGPSGTGSGNRPPVAVSNSGVGCLPPAPTGGDTVQACVSNPAPTQNTQVTVYARLTVGGRPISGAYMDTAWVFTDGVDECEGTTNGSGVASCSLNIGAARKGTRVSIGVGFFTTDKQAYFGSTGFTPQ